MSFVRHITLFILAACAILTATACLGSSESDHAAALTRQAEAAQQQIQSAEAKHTGAIATKEAEIAAVRDESAQLIAEIAAVKAANQNLVNDKHAATSQVQTLIQEVDEHNHATQKARTETRWTWVGPAENDEASIRRLVAFTHDDAAHFYIGLEAYCVGANNYLSLLDTVVWDDETEYTVKVAFDGAPLRSETLWGFGTPSALFADLYGDSLWKSETVTIHFTGPPPTQFTFDTAQLRRMFPTDKSFCDGDVPAQH